VQEAGRQYYCGSRAYFFEKHDGKPPGNWMVHGQHGSITLGSWFGISGPVLCVRGGAGAEASPRGALCGRISAKRVFDVQWSGNEHQTTQFCSGFSAPYHPHKGRTTVDRETDYYNLVEKANGKFSLRQYGADGTLKETLPDGKVTLASQDAIFYIIDGWFGTVITSAEHRDGDTASFGGLTDNPSREVVSQYWEAPEKQVQAESCMTVCRAKGTGEESSCASAFQSCVSGCGLTNIQCALGCVSTNTGCIANKASAYTKCMHKCGESAVNSSTR